MSTIINFKLLEEYLTSNDVYYGGASIYNRKWIDPNAGIYDNKYFNIDFICGTCIILSNDAVNYLLNNKNNIDMKIMDDIAIGVTSTNLESPEKNKEKIQFLSNKYDKYLFAAG